MIITPFQWKLIYFISFITLAFSISMIVITLLLVYEIENDETIDHAKLDFVKIGNWIFASVIVLSIIMSAGGWWTLRTLYKRIESVDANQLHLNPADLSTNDRI